MSTYEIFSLSALGGYLLGSIPFGLVLCFLAGYGDIRKIGSGNIGATNVLRAGNKLLALMTVILDASKAGLAAYIAKVLAGDEAYELFGMPTTYSALAALIAGTCAILGHNFPIWLKFKGGKGVASAFGFVLVLNPQIALLALLVWLIMAFTFRYSSLSAITAVLFVPFFAYYFSDNLHTVFYTFISLLILVRHHANIARLLKGEESKIKLKK